MANDCPREAATGACDYSGDGAFRLDLGASDGLYRWDPLRGQILNQYEPGTVNHLATFVHDPTRLGGSILTEIEGSDAATGTPQYHLQVCAPV